MPSRTGGKATRGSQFWLQTFVNEHADILDRAIFQAADSLKGRTIIWVSPLEADKYREYRDQTFLKKLGVKLTKRNLDSFWPKRGPRWDGLARTSAEEILLVEAKSHIPEAVSPGTGASERSIPLIRESLEEAKRYLNGDPKPDWTGRFYQVTNRLAHLYLLRVLNKVPAHLVFIYFVGDRAMNGPMTADEWNGAVRITECFLGIGRTKLSPYVHHVYLDVAGVRPGWTACQPPLP
jgi:hypothetical protein